MVKHESEEYVERLMHDLKGERAAKKISVLKDTVLYWHNSALFWREEHGSRGKKIKEING